MAIAIQFEPLAADDESTFALFAATAVAATALVADQPSLVLLALGGVLGAATFTDLARFRIPNQLTYPAILAALGINLMAAVVAAAGQTAVPGWLGAVGFGPSVLGLLAAGGAMLVAFVLTGRGAGDVKLAAVIGATLGPYEGFATVLTAHLLAGAFAAALVVLRIGPARIATYGVRLLGSLLLPTRVLRPALPETDAFQLPVPMAGFFLLGALATLARV